MGASIESYRLLVVRPHEIFAPAPSYTTSAAENEMMVQKKEKLKDLLVSWHSNAPASFSVYCETENIDVKSTPGWQRRSERNGEMVVAGGKSISIVRGKNELFKTMYPISDSMHFVSASIPPLYARDHHL